VFAERADELPSTAYGGFIEAAYLIRVSQQ